jgi:transcriptional regulator with XRE-family HTH domain
MGEKMDKIFVERLNLLRGRDSGAAMAKRCGIKTSTMHNYINGETEPGLSALRRIAEAYSVSVGWLAGDDLKPAADQRAIGSNIIQAGGSVTNSQIATSTYTLNWDEAELIELQRTIGNKMTLQNFKKQLLDLKEYLSK